MMYRHHGIYQYPNLDSLMPLVQRLSYYLNRPVYCLNGGACFDYHWTIRIKHVHRLGSPFGCMVMPDGSIYAL